MPLDIDKYFTDEASTEDVRQEGVTDSELMEAFSSQRLTDSYGTSEAVIDDYGAFAESRGYTGVGSTDFSNIIVNQRMRDESRELARKSFNTTEHEVFRKAIEAKTKDTPVINTAVKVWAEMSRYADIALSTSSQMLTGAVSGLVEQVAASGTQGTGAPGTMIPEGENRLEIAKEFVEPLQDLKKEFGKQIDPDKIDTLFGKTIQIGSSVATGAGLMAINPNLGLAAFEGIAFDEAVAAYDQHATDPNPEDRLLFGLSVAIPQAMLDRVVGGEAAFGRLLRKAGASTRGQVYGRLAAGVGQEGLTEGLQGEIMRTMLNMQLDLDEEHFGNEFFEEVLIGMLGAGTVTPFVAMPAIMNSKVETMLDNENYGEQAWKTLEQTFTEEEIIKNTEDEPAVRELLKRARNGDRGAQEALMVFKDQQSVKQEQETKSEAESMVQLSKEGIRKAREARSEFAAIAELPPTLRVRFKDVFNEAMRDGEQNRTTQIMTSVESTGRPLTLKEHAGFSIKTVELTNAHSKLIEQGQAAAEAGDKTKSQQLGAEASAVAAELDQIEHFVDKQRSEAGRILAIGRMRQDREDFSVSASIRAATANKGEALTSKEAKQITDLSKQVGKLQGQLNMLQDSLQKLARQGIFDVMNTKELGAKQKEQLAKLIIDEHQSRVDLKEKIDSHRKKTLFEHAIDTSLAPRALIASGDISAALRQGALLGVGRPDLAIEAMGKSIKAAFDMHKARGIDLYLKSRPTWKLAQKSGLHHSSLDRLDKIQKGEETFTSNVAEKLPWVRWSERHMVTYLNMLRASAFDTAVRGLEHRGMSEEQMLPFLEKYAKYVNAASGRGTLKLGQIDFEKASRGLSTIFFAPRWAVSRFEAPVRAAMLTNTPLSKYAARDFALYVGLGNTILMLASMAGASVSWDPDDSDFGKIVIDDTRIDMWGGFKPAFQLVYNMIRASGSRVDLLEEPEHDIYDQMESFLRYKLSPAANIPFELMTGEDAVGNELDFFTIDPGEPTDNFFVKNTFPLFMQDIVDAAVSDNPETMFLSAPLSFVGVGTQTFDK